ncbi:branched-chain amino acid ABC transporter permease, partial [Chloroflexota bacterium]
PISMGMLGGLWFFLHRVKLGRALRAMTQDPEAAALQGISINRMALLAMAIAAALAGAAGGLMSSIHLVTPYMGGAVILMSLIIVIVGGSGSLEGAVLAAIIFGFLHTIVTTLLDSTVANIIAALVMGVMLAVRPEGLLGREQI